MVEYEDLEYAIGEIAGEESIPAESWEDFAKLVEHQVALREPELINHPDYDRAVRSVFDRLREEAFRQRISRAELVRKTGV